MVKFLSLYTPTAPCRAVRVTQGDDNPINGRPGAKASEPAFRFRRHIVINGAAHPPFASLAAEA